MIRIVNIKSCVPRANETIIRVDRTSVLGNPYHMKDESMRDKVCNMYEAYFTRKVKEKTDDKFMAELRRIYVLAKDNDIALACFCAPKRCHAETIKAFIESYL